MRVRIWYGPKENDVGMKRNEDIDGGGGINH